MVVVAAIVMVSERPLMFTQVHIHTPFPDPIHHLSQYLGLLALIVIALIITDSQVPHESFIIAAQKLQFEI